MAGEVATLRDDLVGAAVEEREVVGAVEEDDGVGGSLEKTAPSAEAFSWVHRRCGLKALARRDLRGDQYSSGGSLNSEYVANVILLEPTIGAYTWNLIYELPIGNTGSPVKRGPGSPVQPDPAASRLQSGVSFARQRRAVIAVLRAIKQPRMQNICGCEAGCRGKCS